MQYYDVIVAGGGISGLSCTEAILRRAPGAKVLCLEASERLGGHIRSVRRAGYVMEGGPSGFLDKIGATRALAEHLGLSSSLIESDRTHSGRWVRRDGELQRFPSSLSSFVSTGLVSAPGRLRMLMEPFVGASCEEESVAQFAARRLGKEAAEYLVEPIVAGIYGGDANCLSLQSTLPHLASLEAQSRSLLMAFLQSTGKTRRLLSFRSGCEDLVEALALALNGYVTPNSPVQDVSRCLGGYEVRLGTGAILRTRVLVAATPAANTARFLGNMAPALATLLDSIPYTPVATVGFGYQTRDVPRELNGFGYLVSRRENSAVLGVEWCDSMYPENRSPRGGCAMRAILGGAHHPEIVRFSDEDLQRVAREEMRDTLGITSAPVATSVTRHSTGLPQYNVGHMLRVAEIECSLGDFPGLFIGGNGMRGTGMDAITRDATLIAQAALHTLGSRMGGDLIATKDLLPPPMMPRSA